MHKLERLPLDMDALDAYSRSFAQALFAIYPDWLTLAQMSRAPDQAEHNLVVEVEPLAGSGNEYPMTITTEYDDVTIFFDSYHDHFGWPDDGMGNPLEFIADILSERCAVISYWNGDRWCANGTLKSGSDPDGERPEGATTGRIRSWRGTHSRDIAWGR